MVKTLEFVTKHFLTLSAAASATGAAVALTFLTGYLSAFDRSLIWVVETTDLLKFTLIGASLAVASYTLVPIIQYPMNALNDQGPSRIAWMALTAFFILILFVAPMITAYRKSDESGLNSAALNFCAVMIFIMLISMIGYSYLRIQSGGSLNYFMNSAKVVTLLLLLLISGFSYGYSLKISDRNLKEIVVKGRADSENIYQKSLIIMMLSHHTIFISDQRTHIVPTADVLRISSG